MTWLTKYQQRDRWSHGDLLRLAHPKAPSRDHEAVFRWILSGLDGLGERAVTRRVKGEPRVAEYAQVGELPKLIAAFEQAKKASSKAEIVKLITEHDLPREAIPTHWLNEAEVWDALLARMLQRLRAIPMGGTDCALPMVWARRNKLTVSGFVTYTDSETWAGDIHPAQALRLYRNELVSDAKAVVVGMTANAFTLADPNDRGMLDVVGIDTTVPAVIADFVRS